MEASTFWGIVVIAGFVVFWNPISVSSEIIGVSHTPESEEQFELWERITPIGWQIGSVYPNEEIEK